MELRWFYNLKDINNKINPREAEIEMRAKNRKT